MSSSAPAPLLLVRTAVAAIACAILIAAGAVLFAPPAHAADQGTGFGTWAPLSASGWHGSMVVGGVHTYCIRPGLPLPTGESTDHGVTAAAAGLSPQQLTGINLLVTTYGQTSDPVQAAGVGWAVKAIADRSETLHSWGYRGESLAEAVQWTMNHVSPAHAEEVARLAERYYAEGMSAAVASSAAQISLTTDPADARRGVVRFEAGGPGTITLQNAVFADDGAATLADARPGADYAIVSASPIGDGAPYSVDARVEGSAGYAAAVRHITTEGGQDTAGPGGPLRFSAETTDATPRPVLFSPVLSTQVIDAEVDGGPFVDDVRLSVEDGVWPRAGDGSFVALRATARVYRTDAPPAESLGVPADATPVGDLSLTSDPGRGAGVYRVESGWDLPGPGVYTAVWQISAKAQDAGVAAHLEPGYAWVEKFGVATQQISILAPPPQPTQTPGVPSAPPAAEAPPAAAAAPPALAATGLDDSTARAGGIGVAAVILGCAVLAHVAQRRRRSALP
ncbi:hypothetical protein [Microbacterium sp. P03]|uniref:hypothetical protein n=1 Tax=Microbacterium sp. P03 TaxID=3366946 RepID=UPI0037473E4C